MSKQTRIDATSTSQRMQWLPPAHQAREKRFKKACQVLRDGRYQDACDYFDILLQETPNDFSCLNLRAEASLMLEDYVSAARHFAAAIAANPKFPDAFMGLGMAMHQFLQYKGAVAAFEIALAQGRKTAVVYSNLGMSLAGAGEMERALEAHTEAIKLAPKDPLHYLNRGNLFRKLNRLPQANADYQSALALSPEDALSQLNRGANSYNVCDFHTALAAFEDVLSLQPDSVQAWCYRGIVLAKLGRYDEALADYDHAISLQPDFADAYFNKALLLLQSGDFEAGWACYEWRWKKPNFTSAPRHFKQTLWLGDFALTDQTILLHAEQGLGDTLQFVRYVSEVAPIAKRVILELPAPVFGLMKELPDNVDLYCRGESLPAFDCHAPLMSLPLAFKTRLDTVPPMRLPLSAASPAPWRADEHFGAGDLKVGIVFSGNMRHTNDHNRSIALETFQNAVSPLNKVVCLQKEFRDYDRTVMDTSAQIIRVDSLLNDFRDTAAIIAQLDLVISVDTSVAHLAASMGKPTWILLPRDPDFRWLREGDQSPWYPGVRLFRQRQHGDWSHPLAAVREALLSVLEAQTALA